jgi:hypothetical protein
MPDEEKKEAVKEEKKETKKEPMVDIDTSGPGAEIDVPEEKNKKEVEVKDDKSDDTTEKPSEQPTVQPSEPKKEEKKDDQKLEDYSKSVQSRISKLTRKMREAERREKAAVDYAKAVEEKRKEWESKYSQVNTDYVKQFETRVTTGMESAQNELARAIESGDATAQVNAQKKIAALSIDSARLNVLKEQKPAPRPVLSDGAKLPERTPTELPAPDVKAEEWAARNSWFGKDRAMTFTAFEIHKDLVDNEGFDPKSDDYYVEIDKRIKVDFPHKFGKGGSVETSRPVQSVASANRSVKPGRKTVRLTSSQVAIAKKLGVPLEEYAKQLNITKEA